MTDARTLITEYVANGSEDAFRELVRRYVDLVHSTAFRMVDGDAHLAQDVTQTVFIDLARLARSLPQEVSLGGWLHRHTWFTAAKLIRSERRRHSRERQAVHMQPAGDHSESNLAELRPVLDEAINRLGAEDRTAIVLRFFEKRDFRSIGEVLGSTEDAAQKRVARALEKLQVLMARRGCSLSLTLLGTALAAEAVHAAPAGLAALTSSSALAAATTGGGFTLAALKLMASTHLRSAAVALLVGASVVTPLWLQHQTTARLSAQFETMRAQGVRLQELAQRNQRLAAVLGRVESTPPIPAQAYGELMKLRGEVGRLRDQRRLLSSPATGVGGAAQLASLEQEWSARADQLRQWAEEHPSALIPELAMLSGPEWINAMYPFKLENEEEYRRAMSNVRANAELRALDKLHSALLHYRDAEGGRIPADIADLTPHVAAPINSSMLGRYQIIRTDRLVPELRGEDEWVITQKAPVDAAWDTRFTFGVRGGETADCRVTNRWNLMP